MKYLTVKTLTVLLLAVLCIRETRAQESLFTVIAASSKAMVRNAKTGEWSKVKSGERLIRGNVIRLQNDNDYIGLAHKNGKCIEIKKEGTYEVDVMDARIGNERNSIAINITGYVINEMIDNQKNSKNMKMLGAVSRAVNNTVELNSPITTNLIEPEIVISWFPLSKNVSSVFHLISPDGKTIYMHVTNDSSLKLDMSDFHLQRGLCYKWFISSANNNTITSDTAYFYLLSEKKISQVRDTVTNLSLASIDEGSILGKIALASFYELNSMNNEALRLYESINSLPVQVEGFKNKFMNFLLACGMKHRAQLIAERTVNE